MAKTITGQVLVSSASNGAGSTTRGRLDLSAADGGQIRWRITNGGTLDGPATTLASSQMTSRPSIVWMVASSTWAVASVEFFPQGSETDVMIREVSPATGLPGTTRRIRPEHDADGHRRQCGHEHGGPRERRVQEHRPGAGADQRAFG